MDVKEEWERLKGCVNMAYYIGKPAFDMIDKKVLSEDSKPTSTAKKAEVPPSGKGSKV